jgi:hypothetical protein
MVRIDDERAEPVMRRIEQLQIKELEAFARRLLDEMERNQSAGGLLTHRSCQSKPSPD